MTKMIVDDDTESSGSRASEFSPSSGRSRRLKVEEVYREVLQRLQESEFEEAYQPGFIDDLWNHFQRLPLRYALDVSMEKVHDVLLHKKLLDLARDPNTRPAFEVRFVQVHPFDGIADGTVHSSLAYIREDENYRLHPPPTFNALSTSELISAENKLLLQHSNNSVSGKSQQSRPLHEVTICTNDKPKLLTRLTALLSEVGLNIQEAHAFSTSDGYSLDVFLVDGWTPEETDQLISVLEKEIPKIELDQNKIEYLPGEGSIPTEGYGDWEIDAELVTLKQKIVTGSNGDLYKGTYCGQDVAVKVLNTENLNDKIQKEFAQEVYILRKVRHKNVVQFIGACTRPPRLCIVTEYMRRGSIYNYLRKQKGVIQLPAVLKVALDVARGMSYLHQNNIVHRDLKTANLLMDENDVVKVADFGVAKVQVQSGVMTAETGTYRWMAPEVIEHKPYNHKVDVFSYSIVLWELLTGKLPYEHMTPLQAALGVVQQGLRPDIPNHTDPMVVELLERCWHQDPNVRPEFSEIIEILQHIPIRHEERNSKRRSVGGGQSLQLIDALPPHREGAENDA